MATERPGRRACFNVEHVARLARLELREEEIQTLTEQLARIVAYFDKLAELDVADEEPMMHAVGYAHGGASLRQDVRADTLEREKARKDALRGAPSASDGFFRVPPVIEPSH